jgi:hypothetical protein
MLLSVAMAVSMLTVVGPEDGRHQHYPDTSGGGVACLVVAAGGAATAARLAYVTITYFFFMLHIVSC